MSLSLKHFNTSDGKQPAIADSDDAGGKPLPGGKLNLTVLSGTDADGLTSGQLAVKNLVDQGTEPGTWC